MYHILIVDDETKIRELIKKYALFEGHTVSEASNGLEAIEICRQNQFDIIIMDVMMPVMGGYEASRRIRRLERADAESVPIIAITANAFQEDAEKCIAVGMNAHLAKPLNIEKMMTTICHLVKKENE